MRARQYIYQAPNDSTASTFGWDFVFAIRYADVNSAIAKAGLPPIHFSQTDAAITIEGDFGNWEVAQGGAGQLVHMRLPISTLTYTDLNDPGTPKTAYNFAATIEVELDFLPQPQAAANGGTPHQLKLRSSPVEANRTVEVFPVDTGGQLTSIENAITTALLSDWLNIPENLQQFNHVFATVNLGEKAAKADFQWLKPTHVSYAVIDMGSLDTSIFAVLCMAGNPPPGTHQVSPYAIPAGKRSGFLISYERFLTQMILPGAGHQFSGPVDEIKGKTWPKDYFELSEGATILSNKYPLKINELEVEDGKFSPATLPARGVSIRMLEDRVEIEYNGLAHQITSAWVFNFDVTHIIQSNFVPQFRDEKFDLAFGDIETFQHFVDAVPTRTTEIIEEVLNWLALVLTVIDVGSLAATKWVSWVDRGVARASQQLVREATNEEINAAARQFAAKQALQGSTRYRLANLLGEQTLTLTGGVLIGGFAWGWENLAKMYAKDDARSGKYLPDFKEFARELMAPLTWPGVEAEYTVEDVKFNASFQVSGNAGFTTDS
jgi:Clostridium P-47 protein